MDYDNSAKSSIVEKFKMANETGLGADAYHALHIDAYYTIIHMRDVFFEYYKEHKRKEMAGDSQMRAMAKTKADVNWEKALKCQEFIDKYPLPPQEPPVSPPQVILNDYPTK